MMRRRSFRPLRPDLDKFLFATVGREADGIPLSMISLLVRLGLDPWEEAGRLSSRSTPEAVEQLARLIVELPGRIRSLQEARDIAGSLVGLLPRHDSGGPPSSQIQVRPHYRAPVLPRKLPGLWLACLVLAAVVLAGAALHGGFPFGTGFR